MPPMITRAKGLPRSKPQTARVAPKERAPTSPSQILAGLMLKYKKAIKAPIQRPIKTESVVSRMLRERIRKAIKEINNKPDARPSRPSEMLTALAKETMTKAAKGT